MPLLPQNEPEVKSHSAKAVDKKHPVVGDNWLNADDNSRQCHILAIETIKKELDKFRCERIGPHQLFHGDCREILPFIGNVHMVFTDPPYGHNNNNNGDLIQRWEQALKLPRGAGSNPRPIANDGPRETAELINWFFSFIPSILLPGGCCCCCGGGGGPDPQFARWSLEMGRHLDFKQMVIWDKGPMGMGWHYRRSYETILIGQRKGASCAWFDETDRIENIIRPGYLGIRKIIPQKDDHPTPKPPELARHFIRLHTKQGQIVLDPFMGGGSTGVASLKEGRRFIGIELDEHWFSLSCRRIEEAMKQPDLFIEQPKAIKPKQADLFTEAV